MKAIKFCQVTVMFGIAGLLHAKNATSPLALKSLQEKISHLQDEIRHLKHSAPSLPSPKATSTDSALNEAMMSNFGGVNRERNLLDAKKEETPQGVQVGGLLETAAYWHTASQPWFFVGNRFVRSTTGYSIDHIGFSVLANLNSYVTTYVQLGTDDSTISLQQGYLLLGNSKSHLYGFAGQKDINFGSFATLNLYAQPLTRSFMVNANTLGIGYKINGIDATASIMNGGLNGQKSAFPYGSSLFPQNYVDPSLYTKAKQLNNFALNASYALKISQVNWQVGAGYLNGTAYANYVVPYLRLPVWDVNTRISVGNFDILGELVSSTQTGTMKAPFRAVDSAISYTTNSWLIPHQTIFTLDYSSFLADPIQYINTPTQFVMSIRNNIFNGVWVGLENAYTHDTNNFSGNCSFDTLRLDITAFF